MPWTLNRYPPAMRGLPLAVRAKAIEIANALLAEGHDDGMAIRVGITKAKEWAAHHWPETAYGPSGTQGTSRSS